jgi:micrococcal nuclease
MAKTRIVLVFVFSFLVLVTNSYSWDGKVVAITDGDTVVCLNGNNEQTKIRLFGIDAPEKKQAFGTKSRQFIADLVFGKIVDVSVVGTDRYGRTIARIFYKGKDAGLLSIQNGFAWHYKKYAPHETIYAEAQEWARENKLGLWVDADPVPPWEFRRSKKQKT